jgi:hypothetical protein
MKEREPHIPREAMLTALSAANIEDNDDPAAPSLAQTENEQRWAARANAPLIKPTLKGEKYGSVDI